MYLGLGCVSDIQILSLSADTSRRSYPTLSLISENDLYFDFVTVRVRVFPKTRPNNFFK